MQSNVRREELKCIIISDVQQCLPIKVRVKRPPSVYKNEFQAQYMPPLWYLSSGSTK